MIEIVEPGPQALVQDLGRPGLAALGVGPSGAADRGALRLGNRLVGNEEGAAALEITLGGAALRALRSVTVALTGAACPLRINDRAADMNTPIHLGPGPILRLGPPPCGLRTYLAVRGGIVVPPVFDSRSTDVLSGIGPLPVRAGQLLPIGPAPPRWPNVDHAPRVEMPAEPVLRLLPGPRRHWFQDDALEVLTREPYEVSADSNRVALRLRGAIVDRAVHDELPSEGVVRGAIQIPPDGQPLLFSADHPVTGGYPVLAVVRYTDLDMLAQLRPGQRIHFALANAYHCRAGG